MTAPRGRTLLVVTVAVVVLVALALALRPTDRPGTVTVGATGRATPTPAPTDGPSVIVPGRPGESAVARPAHEVRDTAAPRYNSLDVWFVRMMIPHHQQALEMAQLAPDRAGSPQVRALAERIRGAQGPEIGMMRGWLSARGLAADVPGHDHGTMRGMQSPEAIRALTDARGAEFDRLFVRMMTDHHDGAVRMATDLLTVGVDQQLNEFATSVATEQAVEIARMRELV
ncbi:DUF305 domain-containing protein [Micromonospora coxensis]|uniref:Uncharacterized conserved protein, DUF305 family n=1 Tax=Micromonospora coxensis TaxID=356852 RepID=A0A1C5H612_9ACTN|nr:DUF305 domain-containing protein [Micromonospora coxensis]SCG41458.1 Uncharacterized conserved protein, DUF305 family [Micromonospora coxensis]